jgi:hypothetical protein
MFLSRQQIAGQTDTLKEKLRYLRTTVTNQNCIYEELKTNLIRSSLTPSSSESLKYDYFVLYGCET